MINEFKDATYRLASDTAKSKIMDLRTTGCYDIEPFLKDIFLAKINDQNTDIEILDGRPLFLSWPIKNQNLQKSFFNKAALEGVIVKIGNSLKNKKIIGYQITIPRPLTKKVPVEAMAHGHAVALVTNSIKKRIIYHDSTGFDIPQELKIIFDKCFKDYTVVDYHDKSQFTEKNDGSCSYLSMLNIYYRILDELGRKPDKDLDFSAFAGTDFQTDTRSEKLREYIWKELKDELIQSELKKIKQEKEVSKPKQKLKIFSFGKSTFVPPELEDPDYELYKDPEFKTWVNNLAKSLNAGANTMLRVDDFSR